MRGHVQKISLCSFLSYLRCFQFPFLSSRERPWTLCLISYSYANWPPSGHGENKGTVFQGRRCGFYDSKCPSFNSEFPEYKFSSPEMKKVDSFETEFWPSLKFKTESESEMSLRSRDSVFRVQVSLFPLGIAVKDLILRVTLQKNTVFTSQSHDHVWISRPMSQTSLWSRDSVIRIREEWLGKLCFNGLQLKKRRKRITGHFIWQIAQRVP